MRSFEVYVYVDVVFRSASASEIYGSRLFDEYSNEKTTSAHDDDGRRTTEDDELLVDRYHKSYHWWIFWGFPNERVFPIFFWKKHGIYFLKHVTK